MSKLTKENKEQLMKGINAIKRRIAASYVDVALTLDDEATVKVFDETTEMANTLNEVARIIEDYDQGL
jgi:hypothetical protein